MNKLNLLLIVVILSCTSKGKKEVSDKSSIESIVDSTIVMSAHTSILEEKYVGFTTSGGKIIVLNAKRDTVLSQFTPYPDFEFKDFNADGLNDVIVKYLNNTPGQKDLFLFNKAKKTFAEVKDFNKFPTPEAIEGTRYYYSYHKSGCADNYWDSDLFYIEDSECHLIANISGNECEGEKGIIVSQVYNGVKKQIDKFNIDVLNKYEDGKWGFIEDYWTRNYARFVN
ncbi:XAC2610-related protein [Fulvivirga ligni]|uniref:XAC2610-related protein n=1 Tax=Fulvivirga ligni TaxID=2904246 RepID=UPI001F34085D|nr:hypothetical protein [Fulvivirga ligni]UII23579.1 hypothetical protein LVD16_10105 [Fulvivirga ligni]